MPSDIISHNSPPLLPDVSLSWKGNLVLLLAGVLAFLGIAQQSWIFLLLGIGGWMAILFLLLQFRHDLARGLEQTKLEAEFSPSSGFSFRAGQEGEMTFVLQGAKVPFQVRQLNLHHSAHLKSHFRLRGQSNQISPFRAYRVNITFETPVAGKFTLHGAELHVEDNWSLFRTYRYIHCPTSLRVLPKISIARGAREGKLLRFFAHQQRGTPQKRVGSGSDLRDIREYRPGDPRRLIAWKHSLRHRKLLCREFESESPLTSYILLDIGQSMREGKLGQRKLDYACEIVCTFAKSAFKQKDSVGLISFDGSIFEHNLPASGQRQFHSILNHLGGLHQITERDFAHITLGSLCHLVNQFLWEEGILAGNAGRTPPTSKQTVEFVWDYIQQHPDLSLPKSWESDQELIDHILRIFCQHSGIELPYRYHQWVTHKAAGLRESIDESLQRMHGGQLIIIISDLGDIIRWEGIVGALRRARQKRHHVIFLSPFSPWFSPLPEGSSKEDEILREMLTLEQWAWRRGVEQMVKPLGIPILSLDTETAPAALLQRLNRLRVGGRL